MTRRIRVSQPSGTGNLALDRTLREFADQINLFPNMSIISTSDGPESNFSGNSGDIIIDVGSSATTAWFKQAGSDSTVGWTEFRLGADVPLISVVEVASGTASGNNTTIDVAHGMSGTPSSVVITPKDADAAALIANPGVYISAVATTTFTINHIDNPNPIVLEWYWVAVINV